MIEATFQALCRELSVDLEVEDTERLGRDGRIEVDGVPMALLFDEECPDRIFCYVDLGEFDQDRREQTYKDLLTLNMLTGNKTLGVFGIDPATDNAIFATQLLSLDSLSGKQLADLLRAYAQQAWSVREKYFSSQTNAAEQGAVDQMLYA